MESMKTNKDIIEVVWLGLTDYRAAWELQDRLAAQIAAGRRSPILLLLEHSHVYTIGRRGRRDNLVWDEQERLRHGVDLVEVDRGGDITYHGPGQLVGYPLLQLAAPGWQGERLPQADFVGYVRRLETVLIQTLAFFGILAVQREGLTGVWVPEPGIAEIPGSAGRERKIASIGVKVDVRGVTRHGFALNVKPQMDYWQGIVACGLEGVQMVSMADLMEPAPEMSQVVEQTVQSFARVLNFEIIWKKQIEGIDI